MSNQTLSYKGYHAVIEFDAEDMLLIGKVCDIQDSLSFHGSSVEEVEAMFHQSIDNYLDLCQRIGKEPDKEYSGSFNVRLSPALHRQAAVKAAQRGIPLNRFIADAVEHEIAGSLPAREIVYVPTVLHASDISFSVTAEPFGAVKEYSAQKEAVVYAAT